MIEFNRQEFYPTKYNKYYASKEGQILSLKRKKEAELWRERKRIEY